MISNCFKDVVIQQHHQQQQQYRFYRLMGPGTSEWKNEKHQKERQISTTLYSWPIHVDEPMSALKLCPFVSLAVFLLLLNIQIIPSRYSFFHNRIDLRSEFNLKSKLPLLREIWITEKVYDTSLFLDHQHKLRRSYWWKWIFGAC